MTMLDARRRVRSLLSLTTMVAAIVLAPSLAATDGESVRLVRPSGSTLVVVEDARDMQLAARFRGEIWLSGRFVARWPAGAVRRDGDEPELTLIPDRASRAKLPYYEIRTQGDRLRYVPERIEIDGGADALRRAVGETQARRLLDRRVDRVEADGRFLIARYSVRVECDAPWAVATLIRADREKIAVRDAMPFPETC